MVSTDRSRLLIVATSAPALLLGLLLLWQWHRTACTFAEAAPGLLLCKQRLLGWQPQTALIRVQSREGLVWPWRRVTDRWVLVDAGAPDSLLFGSYASSLVRAVKRRLRPSRRGEPAGRLDLIILTHAHQVGALPRLLQAYPDAKVTAHSDELPFLVGSPPQPLFNQSGAALSVRAAVLAGLIPTREQQQGVPAKRVVELKGEGGDLAAQPQAKNALHWLKRGVLSFVKVGGHTPGSIAVLHHPSATLLAGDAVAPVRGWMGGVGPGSGLAVAAQGASPAALQAVAKARVMQKGLEWRWLLPLHGGNYSRQRAMHLLRSWPDEVPTRKAPHRQPAAGSAGASASQAEAKEPGGRDTAAAGLGLSPGKAGPSSGFGERGGVRMAHGGGGSEL